MTSPIPELMQNPRFVVDLDDAAPFRAKLGVGKHLVPLTEMQGYRRKVWECAVDAETEAEFAARVLDEDKNVWIVEMNVDL